MPDVKGSCYPLGSSYISWKNPLASITCPTFSTTCVPFRPNLSWILPQGSGPRHFQPRLLLSSLTPKFGSYLEVSSTPVASGYPVHCTPWTRSPARTYSRLSPDKGTRAYCCLTCRERTTHSRPVTSLCDRIRVSFHPAPPWVLY